MRYLQHKGGQKLHIVYEFEGGFTHPVCGRVFDSYRASFNVPLGKCCRACLRREASKRFNRREFIRKHI